MQYDFLSSVALVTAQAAANAMTAFGLALPQIASAGGAGDHFSRLTLIIAAAASVP